MSSGADLSTFNGIASARQELYSDLMKGAIPEARAAVADRMLANQQKLKELPIKVLNFFSRMKSNPPEEQQKWLANYMLGNFGYEPKAIEPPK